MSTTLTAKGQITIPRPIRDAMGLTPGTVIDFAVNHNAEVVLHKADSGQASRKARTQLDRFEAARGKADVPWKTQDLMASLRG
jgi:AbrB family looped-hinge helix DNA binding protein